MVNSKKIAAKRLARRRQVETKRRSTAQNRLAVEKKINNIQQKTYGNPKESNPARVQAWSRKEDSPKETGAESTRQEAGS